MKALVVVAVAGLAASAPSAFGQGNFRQLSQGGQVSVSAFYLGSGTDERTQPVPITPAPELSITLNAAVNAGRGFAAASASLAVNLTSTSLAVSASGGGGGNFPDAGSGSGSASYQLRFEVVQPTLARVILSNQGGFVTLTSDSGFSYVRTQTFEFLDQQYLLPVGVFDLSVFGSGGGGRTLNGNSFGSSNTVPSFSITVIPTPGPATGVLMGLCLFARRQRPLK